MYPIIIAAPHAMSTIDDKNLRERIALTDYEIWKCSDPFTGKLDHFTCANAIHIADVNRLVCDYNRAPNTIEAFREKDFFGREVFKEGVEFTNKDKEDHLDKYWHPFHKQIANSVVEMDDGNTDVILLIDYHNTAGDHSLNQEHEYMPGFVLSNLGLEHTGEKDDHHPITSMPSDYIQYLRNSMESELEMAVEINTVYHGGYDLTWFAHLGEVLGTQATIYSVQVEYNLDYIFNPISKTFDEKAFNLMQEALNRSFITLYKKMAEDFANAKAVSAKLGDMALEPCPVEVEF